jgi:1-deoxy-D-xylulose-5-phosphate reductoisomerase
MKKIAILGCTGSIGTQTLEVVAANPQELCVVALAAHRNVELIKKQIELFHPKLAALSDEAAARELKAGYQGPTEILSGPEGVLAVATCSEADTVLAAMVGYSGLKPTLAAIRAHKNIALANKETLVAAGSIVMAAVAKEGVKLTPVDSEHSAIFQSLQGSNHGEAEKIIITASGGPFRDKTLEELKQVTVEQCLHHPNWTMGKKVTIDSSTLANKGLEIMEAHWLFNMDYDHIEPVIHPQSIVHSLVEFKDGAVMAQLGLPDMRLPIQYALSHPKRWDNAFGHLDLTKIKELTFSKPDTKIFKALAIAQTCGRQGGILPCAFNAANEIAVESFLNGKIKYLDIAALIAATLEKIEQISTPTLEDIEKVDALTRVRAKEILAAKF